MQTPKTYVAAGFAPQQLAVQTFKTQILEVFGLRSAKTANICSLQTPTKEPKEPSGLFGPAKPSPLVGRC